MSRTREERRRRRDIASGIAWAVVCLAIVCGANQIAERVAPTVTPAVSVEEVQHDRA